MYLHIVIRSLQESILQVVTWGHYKRLSQAKIVLGQTGPLSQYAE